MEPSMENCLAQVLQKDMGRRLQVGQEIIDYILDKEKSHDLEQDQTALDKMVDGIASSWVNSSNFKVNGTGKAANKESNSNTCPYDFISALCFSTQDSLCTLLSLKTFSTHWNVLTDSSQRGSALFAALHKELFCLPLLWSFEKSGSIS